MSYVGDCKKMDISLPEEEDISLFKIHAIWWILAMIIGITGGYFYLEGPYFFTSFIFLGFMIRIKGDVKHKFHIFIINEATKIKETMRKENEKQTIYKISSKKHSIKRSPNSADKPETIKNQKHAKNDSEDLLKSTDYNSEEPLYRADRVKTKNTFGMGKYLHNLTKRIGEAKF